VTRAQLEHLIRAAAHIADDTAIVVLGSHGVLARIEALRQARFAANPAIGQPAGRFKARR
jgi:hypothetical protein